MMPELAHRIASMYAFTPDDIKRLASLMAEAALSAKVQAYERARTRANKHVQLSAWVPSAKDKASGYAWAEPLAQGIAETYTELLTHQLIEMEPEQAEEALSDVWQGFKNVIDKIADWFSGFLPWKTEQIADNTWLEGDNDGTEQFVEDVKQSGTDYSMLTVQVLPEESSSDFCADYAGNTYGIDDIGNTVPSFPAHNRCQHYIEILAPDESEDAGE